MTEQTDATAVDGAAADKPAAKKRSGGLNSMLIADLKSLAGGLGVAGAGSMKKAQLIEAIKVAQGGGGQPAATQAPAQDRPREDSREQAPRQEARRQDSSPQGGDE